MGKSEIEIVTPMVRTGPPCRVCFDWPQPNVHVVVFGCPYCDEDHWHGWAVYEPMDRKDEIRRATCGGGQYLLCPEPQDLELMRRLVRLADTFGRHHTVMRLLYLDDLRQRNKRPRRGRPRLTQSERACRQRESNHRAKLRAMGVRDEEKFRRLGR